MWPRHQELIHRDRSWERPRNPMDLAMCPVCRCLVPGEKTHVRAHQRKDDSFQVWLDELGEYMDRTEARLAEVEKRTGIAEEAIEVPARYTAQVEAFYPDDGEAEEA